MAVSTTSVVADVIHKVMISEAAAHFGFSSTGVSVQLRQVRSKLSQLQTYRAAIDEISRLPIALLSVEMSDIKTATQITSEFGLLTNDALIVAAMRKHGISHLATNDDDFDAVKEVVVWKPR